jgi:hypothetical protein
MRGLAADPAARDDLGARGRAYAEEHLERERTLERLERVLLGLRNQPNPLPFSP